MKCLFIYNPQSGKGKINKKIKYIQKRLYDAGYVVEIYATKAPKDATIRAEKACDEGIELLIVAGGDGTLNEAITGIAKKEHRPKIGYIPSGTTNDVAKNLRISKSVKKALNVIIDNNIKKTDIGMINDDYFFYVSAVGVYTRISYTTPFKLKKFFGKSAYLMEALKETVGPKDLTMKIKTKAECIEGRFVLVLILNSKNVGGMNILKENTLDDGMLELIAFKELPFRNTIRILRALCFGFNKKIKNTINLRASEYKISCSTTPVWNVDGESSVKGDVLIRTLEQHVDFIVPKKSNIFYNK